jgi:hypothetical protein
MHCPALFTALFPRTPAPTPCPTQADDASGMSEDTKHNLKAVHIIQIECLDPVRAFVDRRLRLLFSSACSSSAPEVHHTHTQHVSNVLYTQCGLPGDPLDVVWPVPVAPFVPPLGPVPIRGTWLTRRGPSDPVGPGGGGGGGGLVRVCVVGATSPCSPTLRHLICEECDSPQGTLHLVPVHALAVAAGLSLEAVSHWLALLDVDGWQDDAYGNGAIVVPGRLRISVNEGRGVFRGWVVGFKSEGDGPWDGGPSLTGHVRVEEDVLCRVGHRTGDVLCGLGDAMGQGPLLLAIPPSASEEVVGDAAGATPASPAGKVEGEADASGPALSPSHPATLTPGGGAGCGSSSDGDGAGEGPLVHAPSAPQVLNLQPQSPTSQRGAEEGMSAPLTLTHPINRLRSCARTGLEFGPGRVRRATELVQRWVTSVLLAGNVVDDQGW